MNAFSTFANQEAWHIAGWTMVHFLWLGTVVAAIAMIGRLLMRRAAANVRYATALLFLVTLAALPVAIAAWLATSTVLPLASAARPNPAPASATPIIERTKPAAIPLDTTTTEPAPTLTPSATTATVPDPVAPPSTAPSPTPSPFTLAITAAQFAVPYLPWLWIMGTPITFALLAIGVVGTKRLRRASQAIDDARITSIFSRLSSSLRIGKRVTVAVCDRIAAPVLVGILRPIILLPPAALSGWSPDEIEMVLLHELAHVRRWDNLVNLIQRLIESLLFFHPAVWIVSTWVRREREQCCDAFVVHRTEKPQAYAELLLNLATAHPPLAGLAFAQHPLRSRIRRILKLEDDPMLISGKSLALTLAGLLVAATLAVLYLPTLGQAEEAAKDETKSTEAKDKQDVWPLGEKVARSLADAVKEFNDKAQRDRTGRTQPPLTEDEVIAAIRGWIRDQTPVSDEVFATYQKIAETKQLPPGASLSYTTRWINRNGYDFKVWWIDLSVSTGPKSGYGFRIRDTKISSTPPVVSRTSDDEIEILTQHVAILEQQLKRVDALLKTGSPGGSQEQYAAAAYELASAKGELALAQGDHKTAIALFDEALKYAEATLSAVKSAHELGKVDQGAVFRATTNLFNLKLKFVRARREAAGSRPLGKSIEASPSAYAKMKTESVPPVEGSSKSDKSALRYDGKSFDEWRIDWQTELSTKKRLDAVNALAAFGRAGYGKEAADAILDVAGEYDFTTIDNTAEGSIKNAVLDALAPFSRPQPMAKHWLPNLAERLAKEPQKWQPLAVKLLQRLQTEDKDMIVILRSLAEAGPEAVRGAALGALVQSSRLQSGGPRIDEATQALLTASLKSKDPEVILSALGALYYQPMPGGIPGTQQLVLQPELIPLLFHSDENVRNFARNLLASIQDADAPKVVEPLLAVLQDDSRKPDHLAAIRALGAIGPKAAAALPQIETIFSDDSQDMQLRVAAAFAVDKIEGGQRLRKGAMNLMNNAPDEKTQTKLNQLYNAEQQISGQ